MSSRKPLRYILIGTGGWGAMWAGRFLPPLAESGRAVAVAAVDVSIEALQNAREHLGLPEASCYQHAGEALDNHDADFVVVVTPPETREAIIDLALAHDLDILCEKPMAGSIEACCRIRDKVKASGKKMAVTMSHRFDQDKQTLILEVSSGKYGDLNYAILRFTYNLPSRGSWGKERFFSTPDLLAVEGGIHHMDILRALSAADGERVFAESWNPSWSEYESEGTTLLSMRMTNGVRCFYESSFVNASTLNGWSMEYLRAECEGGTLELDRRRLKVFRGSAMEPAISEELPMTSQPAWANAWLAQLFCEWIEGGPPVPTHVDDNIQCAALTFASIESARRGSVVDVQEYLREASARAAAL